MSVLDESHTLCAVEVNVLYFTPGREVLVYQSHHILIWGQRVSWQLNVSDQKCSALLIK